MSAKWKVRSSNLSCSPEHVPQSSGETGTILVFVPSLGAYVTPRVLGGGKNMMLGNLIELQFGQGRNWPLGAALSMTLLIIVAIALAYYVRSASKSDAND